MRITPGVVRQCHVRSSLLSLPRLVVAIGILVCGAIPSAAQQATESREPATQQLDAGEGRGALQKAAQNPVASLISVPIQNNSNFGVGPNDRTQNVLTSNRLFPFVPPRIGT